MKISEWMLKMSENVTSTMSKLNNVANSSASKFVHLQGKIDKFESGMKSSGGVVDGLRSKLSNLTPIVASLGIAMGTIGFTTAAINSAATYQQSLAELSAITGIVGPDLDELSRKGLEVGASSGMGAAKAAEAYKLLASNIDVASMGGVKGLELLQEKTITLAQAAQVDLPTAANTMAATLNQFGLKAEDSTRVINTLAAGAKYGAAEIPDLADALKVAGGTAANANVSLESTVGALEILSQSALKGADAGTGFRNILLAMQTKELPGVNLKVDGFAKSLAKLAPYLNDAKFLTDAFGRENVNAATILIKNAAAVDNMTKSVTNTNTAYEQAAIQTNTFQGKLAKMKATAEVLMIGIGEKLLPPLQRMLDYILAHTSELKEAFSKVSDVVGTVANAIGNIIEVGWKYRDVLMGVGVAYGALKIVTLASTVAQMALNFAMTANPIGLVVLAIGALVGALVYAWNHCEAFRNVVTTVWDALKGFFSFIWEAIKRLPFVSWIVEIVENWDVFMAKIQQVYEFIQPVFEKIHDAVMLILTPVTTLIDGLGKVKNVFADALGFTSNDESAAGAVKKYAPSESISSPYSQAYKQQAVSSNPLDSFKNLANVDPGVTYVAAQKQLGTSDEKIEKYLLDNGYTDTLQKFKASKIGKHAYANAAAKPDDNNKLLSAANSFSGLDKDKDKSNNNADSNASNKNTIQGDKQSRSVSVVIQNLVHTINVTPQNLKEGVSEIRRIVEEELLRAVRGTELGLSNE